MAEADIEKDVVRFVESVGGECLKLKIDGQRGWPDRTLLLQEGLILFVELKTKSGRIRQQQVHWVSRLKSLGFKVKVCRSLEEVRNFVNDEWILSESA